MPESEIKKLLQTPEGKQKLTSAIQHSVRISLNKLSLARKIFNVDILPQAATPTYDYDENYVYIAENGNDINTISDNNRTRNFFLPMFEISDNRQIPFSEIKHSNNLRQLFEDLQERISLGISEVENQRLFSLLNHASTEVLVENYDSSGILRGIKEIEIHDILCKNMIVSKNMNVSDFEKNKYLHKNINIYTSNLCNEDEIYLTSEPELLGMLTERISLQCLPADDPTTRMIGYSTYEQIGMVLFNPNAAVKLKIDPSIEERRTYKKMSKLKNKYRFISK